MTKLFPLKIHLSFLILCMIVLGRANTFSQEIADSLKNELNNTNGNQKVDLLNQISKTYERTNPDSSLLYANQAEVLAEEINYTNGIANATQNRANYFSRIGNYKKAISEFDKAIDLYSQTGDNNGLSKAYNNKGNANRIIGDYDLALDNFLASLRICEEINDLKGIAYASLNAGLIYATRLGEKETKGLPHFLKTLEICKEINDLRCVAYAINNIALVYIELEKYDEALDYHHQSLNLKKEIDDQIGIATSLGNIGDIYVLKDKPETALTYYMQALEINSGMKEINGTIHNLLDIGKVNTSLKRYDEAIVLIEEALKKSIEINSLSLQRSSYQYLYEHYLEKQEFEKALEYHKQYDFLSDSIYSINSSRQIAEMRTLYETEKKEAEINQLTNEKTIQDLKLNKLRNRNIFFLITALLTLLLASFIYYGYKLKQKANRLLLERNKFEIENKKRAISLFGQQVSKEVALELLSDSFKSGSKKLFACIMFLDIRDFTPLVEGKDPTEIIQYQNSVFGFMIDIVSKYHGIINQFLGDGFMATFGAPASSGNDSLNAVKAALEIVDTLKNKCASHEIPHTKVGIGLHSGYIVTGNVGTAERKQYSITGNTVILASRIEQLNKKYQSEILVSKEVIDQLDDESLQKTFIGSIQVKGRVEPIKIFRL